tara:strand:+ start:149 stop:367 length:219 start_codon:yes stop_codon:yes gene_type:complete
MTSEWKDHVASCAREIAAEKETVPHGDDMADAFLNNYSIEVSRAKTLLDGMFNQDIDADLKKYWHATQGDKL